MATLGAGPTFRADGELASRQEWPLRSYLELGALPTAVPCARLHAKNVLHEWRMGAVADTVELLVSEIITNAVRASADLAHQQRRMGQATGLPTVRIWLTSDGHRVLIQVWDGDHHRPVPQHAEPDSETGRGLQLVDALSTRWGCYTPDGQNGKIVWADLTGPTPHQ